MYQPKLPKDIRCPLEHALEFIGGRWKSRILCLLYTQESLRYGYIKKHLDNITDTVLASSLKELIADGLVEREQFPEIPPRVEYALSDKGRELVPFLRHICRWAAQFYHPDVEDIAAELAHCKACAARAAGLKPELPNLPELDACSCGTACFWKRFKIASLTSAGFAET